MPAHNKVHIAGRGSVVRQLRILVSQFRVLADRNALRNPPRQHVPTVTSAFEEGTD
ncbi:hypothetical protein SAMN05444274_1251 [Mariniphaga anaerophila]|uniref:Uncharacterized protein n=1 Tax=Mariniphaga anaerophila TaxID=1484053 RepID=A0A1M5GJW4_9BACT|nr:hypothetical protein [Mariniphaga anaerophila]SHG04007.1 hypothetical protein SAMN05444274_1251 [Mariniphaga anaerophila]